MSRSENIKSTFSVFIFFLASAYLPAQGFLINEFRTLENRNLERKYSDIDGTPYYSNDFVDCTAYLKNGNYGTVSLRYDIFKDEMEFRKDDVIYWLPKNEIKYIRYGSDMIFVTADPREPGKLRYFFLKDDGKTVLFFGKRISLQPMVYPRGYSAAIPERFLPEKNDIYIRNENLPPRKIVTLRDLKALFAGDDAALGFIKSHKVKPDNIEDLHGLVSFINNKY